MTLATIVMFNLLLILNGQTWLVDTFDTLESCQDFKLTMEESRAGRPGQLVCKFQIMEKT